MSFFKKLFPSNLLPSNPKGNLPENGEPKFGVDNFKISEYDSYKPTSSSDRSTVSTESSNDSIHANDEAPFKGYGYIPSVDDRLSSVRESVFNMSERGPIAPIDPVAARKAELEASRQKQLVLQQQNLKKQEDLQHESDTLSKTSKASFQSIEKIDRILAFFSPTYNLLTAVPIVGEILDTAGEFIVKFKEDRKLIAIGDLVFKNTDQMFAKIAEMEKLYTTSTPVTISTTQRGGKSTPKEFIELIELLEELYITLLSMVLTEERINLIAKQLMAKKQYSYMDRACGIPNASPSNCSFNDKILAYIDSRQTIQNKIGDKNVNTNATSWVFRKLKTAGKSIYRYGIAGEMILQLQQLNTFVNTSFSIALAQYVLDVKDELESTIQQIKISADEAVKTAEAAINIVSIRQSISSVQTQIIEKDSQGAAAAGGKRTMKKRGEKKQKKQKFGKTRRTRA